MEQRQIRWMGPVILADEIVTDGLVVTEQDKICYAGPREQWNSSFDGETHEWREGFICPGLIDIHTHGAMGVSVMDGLEGSLEKLSAHLASCGVTGYLATTLTAGVETLEQVLQTTAAFGKQQRIGGLNGARLLGIHLEGPWINPDFQGAQNGEYIVKPTLQDVRRLFSAAQGWLTIVTLAPEIDGAEAAIEELGKAGVILSAGHTGATCDEMKKAFSRGVRHTTHTFNAMRGLHHREPGAVGAALLDETVACELIADGIHVHPDAMRLLVLCKPTEKVLLISDAVRLAGMPDGEYVEDGKVTRVSDGTITLPDGTLAGSILTLNRAVWNMAKLCRVPLHEAVYMASAAPAAAIGLGTSKGRLAAGFDADLILVSPTFDVKTTVIGGQVVYSCC